MGARVAKRHNKTGRSTHDAKHVRLYDYLLTSDAYLSLSCPARALLIEIARVYDGTNNGRLALSVRSASQRCGIAKDTATRAFRELSERGFIECESPGAFSFKQRHAAEWRITWRRCDVSGVVPGNQFKQWRAPEKHNTVLKYSLTVPSFGTVPRHANGGGR
jgi:hypothetical protein